MSDALRETLPKLPKRAMEPEWKPKLPKGMVSQERYDQARAKKASWKAK